VIDNIINFYHLENFIDSNGNQSMETIKNIQSQKFKVGIIFKDL
jgi:hypothetical protein